MNQVIRIAAVVLATVVIVALLWQFSGVLVLFILSLAVAAAVRPVVDRLIARGVPAGLALLLTYVFGIGLLGLVLYAISTPLVAELQHATNAFETAYERIELQWPSGNLFQREIAVRLPSPDALSKAIAGIGATLLVQTALGLTVSVFDNLTRVVVILVLSIYWSADRVHFERVLLSLLPVEQRARARNIWRAIEQGVGAYIRSELVQSVLAGLLLGLGYAVLGIGYPTILALFAALAWLVPLMGAVLAIVPAFLAGLIISPAMGVATAAYTAVVLLLMEIVVEPRFFHRERYHPILTLLVLLVMANAFGILGLIFSPPVAAAIQIFFSQILPAAPAVPEPEVESQAQVAQLRDRLEAARRQVAEGQSPPPEIESLMERLDKLIHEADRILE